MLWLLASAVYVGSAACQPCHAEIYRGYMATPMARSSGPAAGSITAGRFRHTGSRATYEIDAEGHLDWRRGDVHGRLKLDYFIGSGAAGRSYLHRRDGFLFQAPATWYSEARRWDISPGQEDLREMRLARPVDPTCLYCHASRARPVLGTVNRYGDPPFEEGGVACERCHGPGSEHARGAAPMINPAKLEPARRDAVCMQCHLSGESRVERTGKRMALFRPGEDLAEYVAYFVFEGAAEAGLKATSHIEKLEQSQCKQASGERLWCGTCHSLHDRPAADRRAAFYRARCETCHEAGACRRGPDCASCHMPRQKVEDGGHGVLTDHSIPRRPVRPPPMQAASDRRLMAFRGVTVGDRELGLAYAEVWLRTGSTLHRREAQRLLRGVASVSDDPEVAERLAHLVEADGDLSFAVSLYEAALRREPHRTVAAVNLGVLLARRGDIVRAESLWRDALRRSPLAVAASLNLAASLDARGQRSEGLAVLQRALDFDPAESRVLNLYRRWSKPAR
jgi:tetratricopeptide (TPR) repeat protein